MTGLAHYTKAGKVKTMAQKYVVTQESYYFESGFNVGDIVQIDGSSDPMEYGGFVWNASKPRPKNHKEGCYFHSGLWCRESLVPYVEPVKESPDMAELIQRHAEFESAGRWRYRGFIVTKEHRAVNGWHVPGIDPYARGKATRPFKRMRDAFAWIESEYGERLDSHVA